MLRFLKQRIRQFLVRQYIRKSNTVSEPCRDRVRKELRSHIKRIGKS